VLLSAAIEPVDACFVSYILMFPLVGNTDDNDDLNTDIDKN